MANRTSWLSPACGLLKTLADVTWPIPTPERADCKSVGHQPISGDVCGGIRDQIRLAYRHDYLGGSFGFEDLVAELEYKITVLGSFESSRKLRAQHVGKALPTN